MKLSPPTHMKHKRNGNSCSWAGLASQLALLGSSRLARLGWTSLRERQGGKGKLRDTCLEVKETKRAPRRDPNPLSWESKFFFKGNKQWACSCQPPRKAPAPELYRPTKIMSTCTGKKQPANGADSRDLTGVEKTVLKGSCFVLSTCPGKEK